MQAVSASWPTTVASVARRVNFSVLMSWTQTVVTSGFFTIGTSTIGGPDIIRSGGSSVAFFDRYQYSDYSGYLVSWSVSQSLGQYPYGVVVSTANIQLDNSTNLFTPGYDATIGSYILPNRPIKLALGFNGEVLQQFTGFTDQPAHDLSGMTLTMTAADALNYVMNYVSQMSTPLVAKSADQIIAAALGELGFSSSQYVLDRSLQSPIGICSPYGQRWGDILQSLCEAEQGLLFVDENGIVRFWNRQHFATNTSVAWSLDWSSLENLQSQTTPIFNDVTVTARPRVVGATQKVWELGTPVLVPGSSSIGYEIDFSDDDGAMPVTRIDPIVANAVGDSTYSANSASDGSGTDLSGNISVTGSLVGSAYLATLTNSSTTPAYVWAMAIYGTPAKVTDHVSVRVTDTASVLAYGLNPGNGGYTLEIDNDYIQDQGNALSLAQALVSNFKDARLRYTAYPYANPAIQLGDYVQVTNSDTGVVKTLYVVGRTPSLAVGDLSFQLDLEERPAVHYFTIGTSAIAGPDTLAP